MPYNEEDFKKMMTSELKRGDTFRFNCKMCGNCCRKRREPILLTGTDVFRIARELNIAPYQVLVRYTNSYIGESSHAPVVVLKERLDGSCRLMEKGRCSVQGSKPIVCAIYPLGRFWSGEDEKFHYFLNEDVCTGSRNSDVVWTLADWLNKFDVPKTEEWTKEWNKLLGDVVDITRKMKKTDIDDTLAGYLAYILYAKYDIGKPYIEQVQKNREEFKNNGIEKYTSCK